MKGLEHKGRSSCWPREQQEPFPTACEWRLPGDSEVRTLEGLVAGGVRAGVSRKAERLEGRQFLPPGSKVARVSHQTTASGTLSQHPSCQTSGHLAETSRMTHGGPSEEEQRVSLGRQADL